MKRGETTEERGLPRMKKLPAGWEVRKLGEVCEKITDGTHQTPTYYDKGVIFLSSKNVVTGKIDWQKIRYIDDKQHAEMQKRVSPQINDILLAKNGTTGVAAIVDKDISFDIYVSLALLRASIKLVPQFLLHFINSPIAKNQFNKRLKGIGVPNLHLVEIREVLINYPKSLPEQKRIVKILDRAFEAIGKAKANAEKNLRNSRELFESYLEGVFGNPGKDWEEKRLGDVCVIMDGTHFSPKNTKQGKYMYITAKNIKRYYIDLTKITFITEKDHREIYRRCPVKKGDVLYIKDGATAGIATINTIEEEFSLLSSVAVFKTANNLMNIYLVHYMNSGVGRKNFLGYIDGAAITRLTLIKLKNVTIPIPPLPEQKHIVAKIDKLSAETKRLEAIYQQKIAALDELKKSILQKAFEGGL